MRYTIITPTILRSSLIKACESVNNQTCKDWEHIVVVDCEITNDIVLQISHPQRIVVRCEKPHNDLGHTCRHSVYPLAKGDYLYHLDDDNYLSDDKVLEDLQQVTGNWALFPILRYGERFYNDPPSRGLVDTGSFIVKREIGQWPAISNYDADGIFVEQLVRQYPHQALPDMRPLMIMPSSSLGRAEQIAAVSTDGKIKVSIFTPSHNNAYLREAYESIKDQDFHEWIIVFNNGGIPTDFGDPRVKTHLLYKAPDKVGTLKAYACEQATGDVLVELDHDDLLLPDAIEEIKKAFEDPEVVFAYSNAIHSMMDMSKYPRYDEAFGWKYREVEYKGHQLDEFVAFPPTPESVSRIWFGPDHFRAFRRSVYQRIGGHNKDMRVLDDSDIVCRMFLEGKFKHIDKGLYVYRVHGQNSWLKYNKEIQDNVYGIYDKYIVGMAEKWARDNNHAMIDIGNTVPPRTGYQTFSLSEASKYNWALEDNSVGVILATDAFDKLQDPLQTMKEVYRVLVPGGWVFCQVPSTDGRGAFQDPRVKSFWNENSFLYYTNSNWSQYIGTPVRFQAPRLYTTEKNQEQVCWTIAHLISLKDGYRPAGLVTI